MGLDYELFTKLFRLAGSDNDNEALLALRRCKKMLKESGISWNEFAENKIVVKREQKITPEDLARMMAAMGDGLAQSQKKKNQQAKENPFFTDLKKAFGL